MTSNALLGRYDVSGSLVSVSALSVSEGKESLGADITCQRDGLGRLVVPGTALAGCLRRVVVDPLWGGQPGDHEAAVSRITTRDAPFSGVTEQLDVRDGVAIDRNTGAAADRMLHGREVVAPGSTFALSFSLDVVASNQGDPQKDGLVLVTHLVRALEAGISVGGSTTRGLGMLRLVPGATVTWTPLASAAAFLECLKSGPQSVTLPTDVQPAPHRTVTVTIPWTPRSPLLVSVPVVGGVDALPRHVRTEGGVRLMVPGSSIKGVLRSHAERIVRTLTALPIPERPLDQFQQDVPLVREIFGRAPDARGEGGWRGALTCADVVTCEPIADWDDLVAALMPRESRVEAASLVETSAWLRVDDHVAISRWTGGADDGKLFAWVAPWPGKPGVVVWEPMRLTVDLARLGPNADSCLMLLAHVLRDLCQGWLAFGHGTTRGYGEVTAEAGQVTVTWEESGTTRSLSALFDDEGSSLAQAWRSTTAEWIAASREEEQA